MPFPPSARPDFRIFERAMWPQITAGIAVNSQPHVNERTAKMRLQIATGGVRGTVCGTAGRGGGGVSSAIAAMQARSRVSGDFGRLRSIALPKFRKNTIFNRHSQVANRKSFLIRWHLHTGFRKQIR